MRALPYQLCDVFTDRPLTGNQLAVFTDADALDPATMQALAREMNFSESTFTMRPTHPGADARLRIFTPTTELPFAGHPTLGSAFVLAATLQKELLGLETGRGVIPVRLDGPPGRPTFGWMEQPLPRWEPFPAPAELLAALGVERSATPIERYDNGPHHVIVELGGPEAVAALRPDLTRLARLGSLAISTYARKGAHWKTRVFAPGEGIAEDPATGAAAGPLCVHLARHGRIRFGERIVIEQGDELGRPSVLHACATGSADRLERVEVGGSAVVIGRGELRLP
jgi:trans-2,3-dihydro-3-hydroxyanthranilate isomerase